MSGAVGALRFIDRGETIMTGESPEPEKGPELEKGQSGIVRAALLGLCPRCGGKTLFEAPARVAITCSQCELNLGALERGGRLAGVLTAFLAILLMLAALAIEAAFRPPLVFQAAFWAPVTMVTVIGSLRLFKTALLYAAFEGQETEPK